MFSTVRFFLFLQILFLCLLGIDQSSAATITGRLTNNSGYGVSGVTATAYGVATSTVQSTVSDGSGYYTINNLPADTYKIYFDAQASGYVSTWHANVCPGVVLTSNTIYTANKQLQAIGATGIIQGKVTDKNGNPLNYVYTYVSSNGPYTSGGPSTSTNVNGDYSLTVPVGEYIIYYWPYTYNYMNNKQFLPEYYNNTTLWERAQTITVTQGSVTNISPVLEEGGTITGTVSDSAGHLLPSVNVAAYGPDGLVYGSADTATDGTYTISSLPVQSYRVRFKASSLSITTYSTPEYIRWYDAKPDQDSANLVAVTAAATTGGINMVIPLGSLAGTVTDKGGIPLSGIRVLLHTTSADQLAYTLTDSIGQYSFQNLLPDNYKVLIEPGNAYLNQWYSNKYTFADAAAVTVVDKGQATANFVVSPSAGKIGGTVKNPAGAPLANVYIYIYSADSAQSFGSVKTDSNGVYQSGYLAPGNYKLQASGPAGYLYQWYTGKQNISLANAVTLPADTTLTNINFILQPAATISGMVYDQYGTPIPSAKVSALDRQTGKSASTFADANGLYTMYLYDGNYSITFSSPTSTASNYLSSYFNNKSTLELGDIVTATSPNVISNINGVLPPGGIITGTVRKYDGTLVAGMQVVIYDASGTAIQTVTTQADGTYLANKLSSGQYRAELKKGSYSEAGFPYTASIMWYGNKTDIASATPIPVTAPQTTSGIDFTLYDGKLSGTVKLLSGCPGELLSVSYGSVCAYNAETLKQVSCTSILDSTYRFNYLPTGNYKLRFDLGSPPAPAHWYGGSHSGSATSIGVSSPNETSIGSTIISEGTSGAIAVTIKDEAGTPIEGTFEVYDEGGALVSAQSLADGLYKIRVSPYLTTGSISVLGGSYLSLYKNLWYNTKSDMPTASAVSVTAGTTTDVVATITKKPQSELNLYYITASASAGGTLSPVGGKTVRFGSSATYSIVPDTGYQIYRVLIDGVSIGAVTSYTFSDISTNHTISAEFVRIGSDATPPTITSFSLASTVYTYSIPVTSFIATDNIAVDGYCISITNNANTCNWSNSVPISITLTDGTANGSYTIYAFAKDATGNISATATATVNLIRPKLTATLAGLGGGTITTDTGALNWDGQNGTAYYSKGAVVSLTAVADASSAFSSWAGCTSNTELCTATMDTDKNITATFNVVPRARIGNKVYGSLGSAYSAAIEGNTIEAKNIIFTGNFICNRSIQVMLQGGYDDSFSTHNDFTFVDGTFTISAGSIILDRIVIK